MIDPASPEPVEATPRKRLTAAEKATLLERQQRNCACCNESLIWDIIDGKPVYGPMIDEHIIPLELGGSNELANRELRCVPCAKQKKPVPTARSSPRSPASVGAKPGRSGRSRRSNHADSHATRCTGRTPRSDIRAQPIRSG